MFGGMGMIVFSRSTSTGHPSRLRDYGAFQADISTLDTLTITAQHADVKDASSSEPVHHNPQNSQPVNSRFPALTIPSRRPLNPGNISGSSIRAAFLQHAQKAMVRKWPGVAIRLCMTLALLAYLVKSLSWQTIQTALTYVRPSDLLVGLVVGSFGIVLSAYQWRGFIRAQNI